MAMEVDLEDLNFDLPDFSEFTAGIDTICAIDEAMGEESAFRTNMEADLALLDFALEDTTVQQAYVPDTMRKDAGKSNLGAAEKKEAEKRAADQKEAEKKELAASAAPAPAPPPPKAVEKVAASEGLAGGRRKSNADGHECPKCGMRVASFGILVGFCWCEFLVLSSRL